MKPIGWTPRTAIAQVAGTIILCVGLAAFLVKDPLVVAVVSAAVAGAGVFVIAADRPDLVLYPGLGLLALFPFLAAPTRGALVLDPGLLLLWIVGASLVFGSAARGEQLRITLIDIAMVVFLGALLLSVVAGVQHFTGYEQLLYLWLGPYIAGRCVVQRIGISSLCRGIVAAALFLAPFVLYEAASSRNLFLKLFPGATDVQAGLGVATLRFGSTRVQASFGQPIPLAIFLSTASLLSFGLGLQAESGRTRRLWFALALALAGLQAAALARTGWVLLVIGLLAMTLAHPRLIIRPGRIGLAILLLSVILVVGAFGPTKSLLFGQSSSQGNSVAGSANYRVELLNYVEQPGVLSALGTRSTFQGPQGDISIDDEYIALAVQWGFVAAAAFILLVIAVAVTGWRHRRTAVASVLFSTTLANMLVLAGVALLTQAQVFFWLLVGACAGVAAALPSTAGVTPDWRAT